MQKATHSNYHEDSLKTLLSPIEEQTFNFNNVGDLMRLQGHFYDLSPAQRQDYMKSERAMIAMFEKGNMPDDPLHPYYYHIYTRTLPDEVGYRLVPKAKDKISKGLEESKSHAFMNHRRFIY